MEMLREVLSRSSGAALACRVLNTKGQLLGSLVLNLNEDVVIRSKAMELLCAAVAAAALQDPDTAASGLAAIQG